MEIKTEISIYDNESPCIMGDDIIVTETIDGDYYTPMESFVLGKDETCLDIELLDSLDPKWVAELKSLWEPTGKMVTCRSADGAEVQFAIVRCRYGEGNYRISDGKVVEA